MEFEWNISQDSLHCSSSKKSKSSRAMGEPEQLQGRIIFMSMFNDIIWDFQDNEKECIANSTLVSLFAKRFPAGHWSFFGLGSETKWWPGGLGPQGMPLTGGGGLTRVPNLRVCKHLVVSGVPHAGEKDELTSCRGTVWSAWQTTTSETQRMKSRAARKGEWPPHGTGTTVLTYPGSAPG